MTKQTKQAIEFAQSMRGVYILSQALHYGIKELSKVKGVHKEISNIEDMKFLKKHLFYLYVDINDKELRKQLEVKSPQETKGLKK